MLTGRQISNALGILTIQINFAPDSGQVSGLQFDLILPPGLTYSTETDGPIITAAAKTTAINSPILGTERFIVSGLNQNVIQAGLLMTLTFASSGSVAEVMNVQNVSASNPLGVGVPLIAQPIPLNLGSPVVAPTCNITGIRQSPDGSIEIDCAFIDATGNTLLAKAYHVTSKAAFDAAIAQDLASFTQEDTDLATLQSLPYGAYTPPTVSVLPPTSEQIFFANVRQLYAYQRAIAAGITTNTDAGYTALLTQVITAYQANSAWARDF